MKNAQKSRLKSVVYDILKIRDSSIVFCCFSILYFFGKVEQQFLDTISEFFHLEN